MLVSGGLVTRKTNGRGWEASKPTGLFLGCQPMLCVAKDGGGLHFVVASVHVALRQLGHIISPAKTASQIPP